MRTALLFPGQASQFVGMGRDLYEAFPIARQMYDRANEILGYDLAALSFSGPDDQLVQTVHTQPAIFVHSCVMYRLAADSGLDFDCAAGHSLGEYSALVAAGVLTFDDALIAVRERARFMQEACQQNPGTMAAVLGLGYEAMCEICARVASNDCIVVAANYNAEKQIAISGSIAGIEWASQLAREQGAKRVVPLAVGGAFHSPLMHPAPEKLKPVLDHLTFRLAEKPVIVNVTAEPTTDPAAIRRLLVAQLISPVLWYPTLQRMKREGIDHLIEIGPKKVLLGLAKSVFEGAELLSLDTTDDLQAWAGLSGQPALAAVKA